MKKRKTKEKIVSSAIKLFSEKGIKATTTKNIAKKSNVAEGTLYRHFKNKKDLALRIFTLEMDRFTDYLQHSIKNLDNPEEKLKKTINAFFSFAAENPQSYNYIMNAHQSDFGKIAATKIKPKDIFVAIIKEGIEKYIFRQLDENLASAMVIGMIIRVEFFLKNKLITLNNNQVLEEVIKTALIILKKI